MKKYLLFLAALGVQLGFSQQIPVKKGVIIDSIRVLDKKGETYALYAPQLDNEEKQWPVVFVFDPFGRGSLAVDKFKDAADVNGYLIVAPNSILSEAYETDIRMARRLFDEVIAKYPIDQNRMYTSGFSDGGSLATAIAAISKKIKGVIACGASFPSDDKYIPETNTFSYVALVGEADFNLSEALAEVAYLEKKGFDAQSILYKGDHEWPPSPLIATTLRRTTLKAMNKGWAENDKVFAEESFKNDETYLNQLQNSGRFLYAYIFLDGMLKDYRLFKNLDTLKLRKKQLRKNKQFKKQRSELSSALLREQDFLADYSFFLPEDMMSGDIQNLTYWEQESKLLDSLSTGKKHADQNLGKRLKGWLVAKTSKMLSAFTMKEKDHSDNLLFGNILLTLLNPDLPEPYLNVVQMACNKNDYGMALYYMEALFKTGFNDENQLRALKGTALFRIMPEYIELRNTYLK